MCSVGTPAQLLPQMRRAVQRATRCFSRLPLRQLSDDSIKQNQTKLNKPISLPFDLGRRKSGVASSTQCVCHVLVALETVVCYFGANNGLLYKGDVDYLAYGYPGLAIEMHCFVANCFEI